MSRVVIKQAKSLWGKILLLVIMLFVMVNGLVISGCTTRGTTPAGWSGTAIIDDTLLVGSMGGKITALDTANGDLLWEVTLEVSSAGGGGFSCTAITPTVAIYGTPAVREGMIYVGGYIRSGNDNTGKIFALAFNRSEARWIYPRQNDFNKPIIGGPVVAQDRVYIGGVDGKVYALDVVDGYKEWEFETEGEIWSTPIIEGSTLYIGCFDKKLYALDVTDGSEKWRFQAEGAFVSTPFISDDTIYIGSLDRYLYAIDADTGNLKWQSSFLADNWFWAQPVVYNGRLYAGCLDGNVYVVDAKNGNKITEINLGSPIASSPVLVDDLVIFASEDGQVWSIDTSNSTKRLLTSVGKAVYAPLNASNGIVYIHTHREESVYALDTESGTLLWHFSLTDKDSKRGRSL